MTLDEELGRRLSEALTRAENAERERDEARARYDLLRQRCPERWVEAETHYRLLNAAEQDAARLAGLLVEFLEHRPKLVEARAALAAHEACVEPCACTDKEPCQYHARVRGGGAS